jgi:hypothetical protein
MNVEFYNEYKRLKIATEESKAMLKKISIPNFRDARAVDVNPNLVELNRAIDLLLHNNSILNLHKSRLDMLAASANNALSAQHQAILERIDKSKLQDTSDIEALAALCEGRSEDIDVCDKIKEFRRIISKINEYVEVIKNFKRDLEDLAIMVSRQNIEINYMNHRALLQDKLADQIFYITNINI